MKKLLTGNKSYSIIGYIYQFWNLTMTLNKRIPLYEQIEAVLRNRISTMQPGDRIPSDRDLAVEFNVSFVTARQAVSKLVADGLVTREIGRGTFVASPRLEKDMSGLTSFTEDMERRGMSVRSEVLECVVAPAAADVAQALRILTGSPVVCIRRIRFADNIPMALETVALSALAFPGLADEDFSQQSLYEVLERRYSVRPAIAQGILGAASPTSDEAQLLGITRNTPLLFARRTAYDEQYNPIEHGESRYRSDRYEIPIEMRCPPRNAASVIRQPSPSANESRDRHTVRNGRRGTAY
jgi:GntR family transcriptional regulator